MPFLGQLLPGPPPHARGRRLDQLCDHGLGGTTPAGAGTTPGGPTASPPPSNYPRGRGDDANRLGGRSMSEEPPPRARGRHLRGGGPHLAARTTPAGAGTTLAVQGRRVDQENYPRGRGDDACGGSSQADTEELPPRARGRHLLTCGNASEDRSFPSHAFLLRRSAQERCQWLSPVCRASWTKALRARGRRAAQPRRRRSWCSTLHRTAPLIIGAGTMLFGLWFPAGPAVSPGPVTNAPTNS